MVEDINMKPNNELNQKINKQKLFPITYFIITIKKYKIWIFRNEFNGSHFLQLVR